MSTYVDAKHNTFSDVPLSVKEFLIYLETIKNLSYRTINAYYIDLRVFFRYLLLQRTGKLSEQIEDVDISCIDLEFISSIRKMEIYEYLHFVTKNRDNSASARARKLSCLKSFFKYLSDKKNVLKDNPAKEIDSVNIKKSIPKYLTLEESMDLLRCVSSTFTSRDYCIITLFLNCGMRLNELVGININSYKDDTLRVLGKGNKERLVYLNDACIAAIETYLANRSNIAQIKDINAMFISKNTGKRLTARRVQQIVTQCIAKAELNEQGYSTHKLRHTAATLLYRFGGADMLALKEILGHEHVSTTEIYTHISQEKLKEVAKSSPLSTFKKEK